MKNNFTLFVALFTCVFYFSEISAQGCVAIRGNSSCSSLGSGSINSSKGEFNLQLGMRYFKSFRHFRGSEEETHRIEEGTEVVNYSTFVDIGLNYGITDRLFANLIVPIANHDRSSMYEHGGNPPNGLGERHHTASFGLSDIRLGVGYWLFNPQDHAFNYAVGLGVKLPTGKYDCTDLFYNQGENRDEDIDKVVDQSIQLGDGGTGITLDLQGFHPIGNRFSFSTNLYYLFNVQETNGVLTRNGSSEFSCPDQFAARIGVNYILDNGLGFYLGGRGEGVPATDAIGGSDGYRRPGYAISVEPGISYFYNAFSFNLSVPVALYRNRIQSFQDKERTLQTGVYRHGDAAFADYLINFGVNYRFGGARQPEMDHSTEYDVKMK